MTGAPLTSPRSTPPPADLIPPGESWRDQAACFGHPRLLPSTWDDENEHDRGRGTRQKRIAAAIAVCNTCPVRLQCLDDVDLDYDRGVRGGIDLRELLYARMTAARVGRRGE